MYRLFVIGKDQLKILTLYSRIISTFRELQNGVPQDLPFRGSSLLKKLICSYKSHFLKVQISALTNSKKEHINRGLQVNITKVFRINGNKNLEGIRHEQQIKGKCTANQLKLLQSMSKPRIHQMELYGFLSLKCLTCPRLTRINLLKLHEFSQ